MLFLTIDSTTELIHFTCLVGTNAPKHIRL